MARRDGKRTNGGDVRSAGHTSMMEHQRDLAVPKDGRGLYSAHQDQNKHYDQNDAENARREVAEASRIAPRRQRADEQENKNDEKNCAE